MSDEYRKAGVDIDAADEAVNRIARHVKSTQIKGVVGGFGGFGGLFDLDAADIGSGNLLVSGADGVGTKLKLAFLTGRHDTVGIDCVAMCVNDILALGARPLFFLDYLAVGKLDPETVESIVSGVARGCREAECALLGGETAELPGFYSDGEYDLAGFAVGAVHRDLHLDGSRIIEGDQLVGLRSSGFHSNGYSLIRRVLVEDRRVDLEAIPDGLEEPLGQVLLRPTRIYVRDVLPLLTADGPIHGMVHVTGGGLLDNLPRILPNQLGVALDQDMLDDLVLPEFELVRRVGELSYGEMYRVFNMGVGFVLVTDPDETPALLEQLGDQAAVIGQVVSRDQLSAGQQVQIPRCR